MPKKVDPADVLSDSLLRALLSRQEQGRDPEAITLRQLAALCEGTHPEEWIVKAAGKKAFTTNAVVTNKVDRKPTLDSLIYLKGHEPRKTAAKPRAPRGGPKEDPVKALGEKLLLVLDSQRQLGAEAYPPTLRRLAELCGAKASDTNVPKAANQPGVVERVLVAAKGGGKTGKPLPDAPIFFREDLPALFPALLRFALQPATTKGKKPVTTHAFPATDLKTRLTEELRAAFEGWLNGGIERRTLPAEVGWVQIKGKPHLFLVEHMQSSAPRPALPADQPASIPPADGPAPPSKPSPRDFAAAFREAFERLDRQNRMTNFVKLADLRRALGAFSREEFDGGLRELRLADQFALDSHEGLHGNLTPEERDAGVREAGSLLIYASRR